MNKLKVFGALCLAFALVGLGYALAPKPIAPSVTEKTVFVDRIVEKQILVDKTKTTKLPDGTLIVETDKSHIDMKAQEHRSVAVKAPSVTSQRKYSLGLSVGRTLGKHLFTSPNVYQMELGHRLLDTHLWLTTNLSTDKTLMVGIRFDF